MDRWTMEELQRTDDIDFAISILNERRAKLTPYSPLGMKIAEAAHTLASIKEERDRYLVRIADVFNHTAEETADSVPQEMPVEFNEATGTIVSGHQRLEAMKVIESNTETAQGGKQDT